MIIVAALIIGGVVVTAVTSNVNTTSEAGVKMDLPIELGQWHGRKIEPSELEVKLLPKETKFEKCVYTNDANESLYCSIVLSSPDPRSIHRPELCLPTQGVRITSSKLVSVPVKGLKKPLPLMQLSTRTPLTDREGKPVQNSDGQPVSVRGYFIYWFVGKDRITAQHYQRVLWNMWDRTFFNTNHRWAYIIVQGSVPESYLGEGKGKNDEQTLAMLKDFVAEVFPTINETKSLRE